MQVTDPPFVGDWVREKKIGSGGFGVVTLWKNTKTDQRVAVKRCHPAAANDKHSEAVQRRWHLEVGYMTEKVSHDNIVRGIRVEPASFLAELERKQPTAMPVLLMEYCEGGDLRRLLNTSEYATGFPEMEARAVLRSLGAAIAYLHQIKITHRDIKPENIVIKTDSAGRKVYKLTDLGYAKALDHQTLVASLVGTLEYIAPELCMTDRYTNTVDYWSMGVIAYEICTGVRPFVPHLPLARWMVVVKNKKAAHIAITEGNEEDSIRYESELPAEHRLSGTLAALLAPWLRLALEWNPKQRGHVFKQPPQSQSTDSQPQNRANQLPPTLELRIFSQLTAVLDQRILRIFDLHTCRTHSIVLSAGMTMAMLLAWIASCTQIAGDKVRMVLPVAHPLEGTFDMQTPPTVLWWPDHDGPMLFIYRVDDAMATSAMTASTMALRAASSGPATPPGEWALPEVVREFVARPPPQHKWRPHVVRRFATAAFHACRAEQQRYREALVGWHSLALRLDHAVNLMQTPVEKMQRQVYQLEGAVRMASDTMRLLAAAVAAEQLGEAVAVRAVEDGTHERYAQLMERTRKIVEACEKIARRYKSVHRRSQEACHRRLLERREGQDLFGIERMGKTLEILRIQLQQKASVEVQVRDMLQAVEGCRQRRLELLQEKEWFKLQEFPAMAFEIEEIQKAIDMAISGTDQYQKDALELNAVLFKSVQSQAAATQSYLPAIDGIGVEPNANSGGGGVRFQIGQVVTAQPISLGKQQENSMEVTMSNKSMLLIGEEKTTTLITDNREIMSRMETMINQMNHDLMADAST